MGRSGRQALKGPGTGSCTGEAGGVGLSITRVEAPEGEAG